MRLHLIAAVAENRVIGRDNRLPWHLPADLRHFQRLTMGHALIMGRKTFELIGRPLPGRVSIVLTQKMDYRAEGALVVHGLREALSSVESMRTPFVIGGAEIYRLALPSTSVLHLTRLHTVVQGDVLFPEIRAEEWILEESQRFPADALNPFDYSFERYQRRADPELP